jgi:hypothetical protein
MNFRREGRIFSSLQAHSFGKNNLYEASLELRIFSRMMAGASVIAYGLP